MQTRRNCAIRQISVCLEIHQIIGVTQLEFGINTIVVGIEQRLEYFGLVLIGIQTVGGRMPFAPCADKACLPYKNIVAVFGQNGAELLNMAFYLRQIRVLTGFGVVV